jgi:hypothetical protein
MDMLPIVATNRRRAGGLFRAEVRMNMANGLTLKVGAFSSLTALENRRQPCC